MTTDIIPYSEEQMAAPPIELSAGWADLMRPRYLVSTITLCLGVALFAFNEFFISTALPTAVDDLGGAALLSWAFTLYLVFAIVGGMVAANLKQRSAKHASGVRDHLHRRHRDRDLGHGHDPGPCRAPPARGG